MPGSQFPDPGKIISLPRTRRLSWTAISLEACHQIVLSLWIGGLVATVSLAVPALLDDVTDPVLASQSCLGLLARLDILGCGAGAFLLLTTLLMHLLSLRTSRVTLLQGSLILAMTLLAIGAQIGLTPSLSALLREHPDLFHQGETAALIGFRQLFQLNLGIALVQALLGCSLLLLGVRRWYRYQVLSDPES